MGRTTLLELLKEFAESGGQGIEVVSGSHTPPQFAEFARYATEFGLLCSCGSDFHGPEESYRDLGRLPDLPLECRPVWENWPSASATVVRQGSPEFIEGVLHEQSNDTPGLKIS